MRIALRAGVAIATLSCVEPQAPTGPAGDGTAAINGTWSAYAGGTWQPWILRVTQQGDSIVGHGTRTFSYTGKNHVRDSAAVRGRRTGREFALNLHLVKSPAHPVSTFKGRVAGDTLVGIYTHMQPVGFTAILPDGWNNGTGYREMVTILTFLRLPE